MVWPECAGCGNWRDPRCTRTRRGGRRPRRRPRSAARSRGGVTRRWWTRSAPCQRPRPSWARPSQGVGAVALAGRADVQGARPAADARGPAAGPDTGRPRPRSDRARRHDHDGAAGPDVGDGRDELSDAARGDGHGVRGRGSLCQRVHRGACRQARDALRGRGAAAARDPGAVRGV